MFCIHMAFLARDSGTWYYTNCTWDDPVGGEYEASGVLFIVKEIHNCYNSARKNKGECHGQFRRK